MSDLRVHELKCRSDYFEAVERGDKPFELCDARDRDFHVGDFIVLRKFDGSYAGGPKEYEAVCITFVLKKHEGLAPGFAVLAIRRCTGAEDVEVVRHWRKYGGIASKVRA